MSEAATNKEEEAEGMEERGTARFSVVDKSRDGDDVDAGDVDLIAPAPNVVQPSHSYNYSKVDGAQRVWCATCGRFEKPSDTAPAIFRVEQKMAPGAKAIPSSLQNLDRDQLIQYYHYIRSQLQTERRYGHTSPMSREGTNVVGTAVRATSSSSSQRNRAASPRYGFSSSPHRPYSRGGEVSPDLARGRQRDADVQSSVGRESLVGEPSLEVMSRPPLLPSLEHDALACLSFIKRTNEALRNFQVRGRDEVEPMCVCVCVCERVGEWVSQCACDVVACMRQQSGICCF